jgi:hypothetical protein
MEDWTDPLSIAIMPRLSMIKMLKWKELPTRRKPESRRRVREAGGSIDIGATHSNGGGIRHLAQGGHVDDVKWLT